MSKPPANPGTLTPFFRPRGVAVIGASRDPDKMGYAVLHHLADPRNPYPGPIYPINPKAEEILGLRCYPDIGAVPDPVELAVLVIPAEGVAQALEGCGRRGIKCAIVVSSGFGELGPKGKAREQEIVAVARRYQMRVMGPNCVGVIDTSTPLNTTFAMKLPARGNIAFLSQSGALGGGIMDWTFGRGLGFSRFLSIGNEADLHETDMLPLLADDERTRVITLYLEDVKGGPAFVEALRRAAAHKPVLAVKAGRTAGGQAATASHTGALAGVHAAFRAACKQTGAMEIGTIEAMFNAALALAYQPLPAGDSIAIVSNAGGPAALAADALEGAGLHLARTGPQTQTVLRGFLHPDAQVAGPVDMLGGADEHQYRRAIEAVLADPSTDGVLVCLVPHFLLRPAACVEAIGAAAAKRPDKPVLACLMGQASLEAAFQAAHAHRIPAYVFPEDAVAAFGVLRQRARWLARPHHAPAPLPEVNMIRAFNVLGRAREAGERSLDAFRSKLLLASYGLFMPAHMLAASPEEAVTAARRIGFPVALKLVSPDIPHKTDVGGVLLDVRDEDAVRAGFQTIMTSAKAARPQARLKGVQVQQMVTGGHEVIIGVKRDPTFGPLVMFGLGGIYVEVLADVSFRLAPLTEMDAWEMIDEVRSAKLLAGLRGAPPADRKALVDAIVRVGQLAANHPEIAELDINPLMVLPEGQGAVAVDARVILID